jgi:hypothetical protein
MIGYLAFCTLFSIFNIGLLSIFNIRLLTIKCNKLLVVGLLPLIIIAYSFLIKNHLETVIYLIAQLLDYDFGLFATLATYFGIDKNLFLKDKIIPYDYSNFIVADMIFTYLMFLFVGISYIGIGYTQSYVNQLKNKFELARIDLCRTSIENRKLTEKTEELLRYINEIEQENYDNENNDSNYVQDNCDNDDNEDNEDNEDNNDNDNNDNNDNDNIFTSVDSTNLLDNDVISNLNDLSTQLNSILQTYNHKLLEVDLYNEKLVKKMCKEFKSKVSDVISKVLTNSKVSDVISKVSTNSKVSSDSKVLTISNSELRYILLNLKKEINSLEI